MKKIITFNLNGIRAAARYGFFDWLTQEDPDIVCLQELKADHTHLEQFKLANFHSFYLPAEKKGYSGVGLYTKDLPKNVYQGLGFDSIDREGRYLRADYKDFSVVSLYLPSGSSGPHRQEVKFNVMDFLTNHFRELKDSKNPFILCGDWNIAHKEIDLKNWRSNKKNSGFLPEEREWLDKMLAEDWLDAFRFLNKEPEQYTWWSQRGQAYAKNVGWRIDYQIVSPILSDKIRRVEIYKAQKFSDHAPLIIEYDL